MVYSRTFIVIVRTPKTSMPGEQEKENEHRSNRLRTWRTTELSPIGLTGKVTTIKKKRQTKASYFRMQSG